MTPEKQRIAIAEACGWKPDGEKLSSGVVLWDKRTWINLKPYGDGYLCDQRVPDYLNDLNAMHEAENNIRNSWDTYLSSLIEIRWRDAQLSQHPADLSPKILWRDAQPNQHPADLSPTRATAAQRAEAFLKTIDKWEGGSDES